MSTEETPKATLETPEAEFISENLFLQIGKYRVFACMDSLIRQDETLTDKQFVDKLVSTARRVWRDLSVEEYMPKILETIREEIKNFNVAPDEVKELGVYKLKFKEHEEYNPEDPENDHKYIITRLPS